MAVKKNRPDDVPQDFSFLSGIADAPQVSKDSISDQQLSSGANTPDVSAFQPLIAADDFVAAAASALFPPDLLRAPTMPVETVPVETVPVETMPIETMSVETMPVETMPVETMPVETMPVETMPIETMPIETMPIETMPIETMPIETMPVETVPVEAMPVETMPVETMPIETMPVETMPVETMPIETMRFESVLIDSMSMESVLDDSMSDESMEIGRPPVATSPITTTQVETRPVEASLAATANSGPPVNPQIAAVGTMPNIASSAAVAATFSGTVPSAVSVMKPAPETAPPNSLAQQSPDNPVPRKKERSALPAALAEKLPGLILGYAVAVTLLLLFFLFTGRLSGSSNPALESLPDIRPLPANEFRKVPDGTSLPAGHVMKLGESRRFGDVVLTPVRVTREPLKFQHFLSGKLDDSSSTGPVLKLWLQMENVADDYAFPPFDAGLMSYRSPPYAVDETANVNSFLTIAVPSNDKLQTRVLNFLQTMDSIFVLAGQESARVIMPHETLNTFMACSEDIAMVRATGETEYTWRIQFRKGVHLKSGNGVTTLVDVTFQGSDISENAVASMH